MQAEVLTLPAVTRSDKSSHGALQKTAYVNSRGLSQRGNRSDELDALRVTLQMNSVFRSLARVEPLALAVMFLTYIQLAVQWCWALHGV